MKTIELVDKSTCCNCKLCEWECPKKAISFVEDEFGFVYPQIKEDLCVNCGMCLQKCSLKNMKLKRIKNVYCAVNKENELLAKSASGGVFSAIAKKVLARGGVVYGAALEKDEELVLAAKHIRIDDVSLLHKIQGSKYVQSSMDGVFSLLKEDIKQGREIIFSGTPCQVLAVKSAFGELDNLLLIDVICHGVPSQKMFTDYLKLLRKKNHQIEDFSFRSKDSGWGLCAKIKYTKSNGKVSTKLLPCDISSYYKLFLQSAIYRESCYNCAFATGERASDLTIGDFWGVEKAKNVYSALIEKKINVAKGVSCALTCSDKGERYLKEAGLFLIESDFGSVALENKQLMYPSTIPNSRENILNVYKEKGFKQIDKDFQKKLSGRKYLIVLKNKVPVNFRFYLKKLLKRK